MKIYASTCIDKLQSILKNNARIEERYFAKWGINGQNLDKVLKDENFHGGVSSKEISINNLNIKSTDKVLDIGPETGLEIFLLGEITPNITVFDPDEDNMSLLQDICSEYVTERGIKLGENTSFLPYGLYNTRESSVKERSFYEFAKKSYKTSLPTYYKVTSTTQVKDSKITNRFNVVYIHKIFSTLCRSSKFKPIEILKGSLEQINPLLQNNSSVSWSEPKFVLRDREISDDALNKAAKNVGMKLKKIYYKLPINHEEFVQLIFYRIY
jgi:hypothetical protein